MKIANFSVDRPVTISMIMVVLVLLGVIAMPMLKVDLYPNLSIPVAVVSTTWNGSSPDEVEQQISKPIESAMATVPGVSEVDSTSSQNSSRVTVRFNFGENLDQATLSMRDKLDKVRKQLPADADQPTVTKVDPNSSPIMTIALSGSMSAVELKRLASDVVQQRLSTVDGVASVSVTGGQNREIDVLLDPEKMQAYGLSTNQVSQALQGDNINADGGLISQGKKQVTLHMNGQFINPQDIGNVPIKLSNGSSIFIRDIATINDTFADVTQLSRTNGMPSVSLDILKSPDGNTVQVSKNVQSMITTIEKSLPKSVKLTVVSDQAKYIQTSINTVIDHTLAGAGLSVIILYLFLQRLRTTLIIGIVIPISIISTFSLMYFTGQTINTVTLGGLALGMGSLVDFAVVVIESIFRYSSKGLSPIESAKLGTSEVGTAVMASALSQICVFAPVAFTQGMATQLFGPLALTVVFSHIAALFGAVTLVPMLSSKWLKGVGEHDRSKLKPVALFQDFMKALTRGYSRLLKWSLGHRKTVIIFTLIMFGASTSLVPLIGFELTPNSDQGQFKANIRVATNTKLEETNKVAAAVERVIESEPEVTTVFTQVGTGGGGSFANVSTDRASIQANLKPLAQRTRSTDQVVEDVRNKVANIPGAKITISAASNSLSFGHGGSGVDIDISGDNTKVLQKLATLVENTVSTIPGIRNLQNSLDQQVPQFQITMDRQKAAQYGLSISQIVSQMRDAYKGNIATQFHTLDSSVNVIVKYPKEFTSNITNLSRVMISTSSGAQIALSDVANVSPTVGPSQISRTNQVRTITVSGDLFNANAGVTQQQIAAKIAQLPVPDGYTISQGGQAKDLNQSFSSLGLVLPLAIILVYIVMASQFESLFSPFIIMFSLPPTFIGAAIGLVVTGRSLSINAIIGIIMLVGIVVNNAIVLVDYTNQLRKGGLNLREALLEAGPVRLRPILMTTATTVLAMFPLVLGFGEGAEAQAPMATVVAFGLTFSTLVTLILIPVVYTIFDDLGNRINRKASREPEVQEVSSM
ncbi:HAE1 family hydrophobic/amphiphilic exporter-1 [Aneurinibacillus soli]|uniref:Swarming motility protein SwrC n=1 Tax=Aneurinibacillus soli TaxID=1500254 RepID=A0A0U5B4U1_9BACL|nr:efflux RND transporter permease subunit [Aneurinibacillus soli]PYE61695.1 HAE1 family hydrophobic/amphiphilic exporter-1 [Aneurinibacillus soli]BAU28447.1 Swarming motility protein SwrC [Aneurinibacillus soli]